VSSGSLVHYEQTVRERVARPWIRSRRVCTDTLVHYEQTDRNKWPGPAGRLPRRRFRRRGRALILFSTFQELV